MTDGSTLADRIRRYAIERYFGPARLAERRTVTIRAGDLHRKLGLTGHVPAVCSALGSTIFARLAGAVLIDRVGPRQARRRSFATVWNRMPTTWSPVPSARPQGRRTR